MPDGTTPANPQAGDGQQPQAGTPGTNNANPPAGAAQNTQPSQTPPAGDEPMSLEEAKKLRQEANALRKRIKDIDDAQAAADLAKLGELERANKQLSDLQAKHADFQRAAQERIVGYEVRLAAADLQFHNPGAAVKLLDWSQLEFDDDGIPTNAAKLLKKLSETDPWLVKPAGGQQGQSQQQQPPKPNPGTTNPGRGTPANPTGTQTTTPGQMARFGTGQRLFTTGRGQ